MRFKSPLLLILLTLAAFLGSCKNAEVPARDTFVVAISAAPKTLDPRYATDAVGQRLVGLLFNALVRVGPDLKIVGDAAKRWTYHDLTYSFDIQPGLSFASPNNASSGFALSKTLSQKTPQTSARPLTAQDVEFSFTYYMGSKSPFQSAFSMIQSVQVERDEQNYPTHVHLKLKNFSAALLTDLSNLRLLPARELTADPDQFIHHPFGTGGFRLEAVQVNQIHLRARADHPYSAPHIPNVVFKIIQDDGTRYLKTRKGGVDLIQSDMPLNKIKDFENLPDFHVVKTPGLSTDYVLFNLKDPALTDLKLREAFATSINRNDVIQYKLSGLASPATTILSLGNPFLNEKLALPAYDPAKAKALVSGLKNIPPEFVLKTSSNPEAVEKANVLAHQFESAGLHTKLLSYEWGTFYSDISKGNFQIAIMRWTGVTEPDIFRLAFHSREIPANGHGRNRGSYENPQLDHLLDQGLEESNEQKRRTIYNQVESIIAHDLPIVPLWHEDQVSIVHRRVQNYKPTLNGDFSPLFQVTKSE